MKFVGESHGIGERLPLALAAGDTITTEWTWNNTAAQEVTYGERTTGYSIRYRFPGDGVEFCSQGPLGCVDPASRQPDEPAREFPCDLGPHRLARRLRQGAR